MDDINAPDVRRKCKIIFKNVVKMLDNIIIIWYNKGAKQREVLKMKVYYMDMTTNKQTVAANVNSIEHNANHTAACEWFNNSDDVAIINAETGEIITMWVR